MNPIALLSVSDKSGLVPFAQALVNRYGYRLLSTGGTARLLREAGLPVTEVSAHTGFPEMMEGRIKTLHPLIHGGLLCRRDQPSDLAEADRQGISLIDLVVVNLYPFEQTIARPGCAWAEAIENIDIGGPAMLRSAAKNHASVTVVCDPADYGAVLTAMEQPDRLAELRRNLAAKVFAHTSAYDGAIATYFESQPLEAGAQDLPTLAGFPKIWRTQTPLAMTLRYGENPHQRAALYGRFGEALRQLQGKELSYNNILDISAALGLIGEFEAPTVAILKHNNPCGLGSAETLAEAWELAYATDRQAPFGGIIAVNRVFDEELAARVAEIFCEVLIAPDFNEGARARLAKKKNLRLMQAGLLPGSSSLLEIRSVTGGFLVQDSDRGAGEAQRGRVVTKRPPTDAEWEALIFGWKVVKHVKSNAIVYAGRNRTLGIGAGQMSRVDSSRLAVWKAEQAGLSLTGSAIASDAFFPFPDGLVAAAQAGATACIQPGGSVKDEEVIAAADAQGMTMIFTGVRHFRH